LVAQAHFQKNPPGPKNGPGYQNRPTKAALPKERSGLPKPHPIRQMAGGPSAEWTTKTEPANPPIPQESGGRKRNPGDASETWRTQAQTK
jgi:hypothetical protein